MQNMSMFCCVKQFSAMQYGTACHSSVSDIDWQLYYLPTSPFGGKEKVGWLSCHKEMLT